jgi:hypothetical protein
MGAFDRRRAEDGAFTTGWKLRGLDAAVRPGSMSFSANGLHPSCQRFAEAGSVSKQFKNPELAQGAYYQLN